MAELKKCFVVFDSRTPGLRDNLAVLGKKPPAGWEVIALDVNGKESGSIQRIVQEKVAAADVVLVMLDDANANVGYEAGLALGFAHTLAEKRIIFASASGKAPEWTVHPPFRNQLVWPGDDIDKLRTLITERSGVPYPRAPKRGKNLVLLCPTDGQGPAAFEMLEDLFKWTRPNMQGWMLEDMGGVLDGVERIVWVVPEYARSVERDSPRNVSLAVLAGFAKAHGIAVHVFCSKAARKLEDIRGDGRDYDSALELPDLVREVIGTSQSVAQDPLAAYRAYLRRAHRDLVPFFSDDNRALKEVYVELELSCEFQRDEEAKPRAKGPPHRFEERKLANLPANLTLRKLLELDTKDGRTGRYVLLGEPGAGKSTIGRHLCFELASATENLDALPVPIFFSLARLARTKGKSAFELAAEDLARDDAEAAKQLAEQLRDLAREGRIWIFADGLDEVAQSEMTEIRDTLARWSRDEDLAKSRLVVTSRRIGYQDLGEPFETLRLKPLEAKDAKELLRRWIGDRAEEVWKQIAPLPTLVELAENPLMLTLIAKLALHAEGGRSLPPTRVRLYNEAVDLLLRRGFGKEPKTVKDRLQAPHILRALSLSLQETQRESWVEEELGECLFQLMRKDPELADRMKPWESSPMMFLDDVSSVSGLIGGYRGKNEPWRFFHRSFREYFAAGQLTTKPVGERNRAIPDRAEFQKDGEAAIAKIAHWSETFALLVDQLPESERFDAMTRLQHANADLTFRVLDQVEGLPLADMIRIFSTTDLRDGDRLLKLIQRWRIGGLSDDVIQDALIQQDRPGWSIEEVAYVVYALEQAKIAFRLEAFFAKVRIPLQRPQIDVVRLPLDGARKATYAMGFPNGKRATFEHPQHEVTLSPFQIGTAPITESEFAAFSAGHAKNPTKSTRDLPIVGVSWWEAWLFARWLGGSLPTEAQWEYACRGGTTTPWWTGKTKKSLEKAAWFDKNAGKKRHPVRKKAANAFGLYDVHGNVWEWCSDWAGVYPSEPQVDPGGPANGPARMIRGGSYKMDASRCRSAFRFGDDPGGRWSDLGFRVVLPAPAP